MTRRKLNNPPIKEVIIGLSIDGLFSSLEDITLFCDNFSLKEKYVNKEEIQSVTFEVGEEPKIIQNTASGIVIFTANDDETIHIQPNNIMFTDKTKYESFEIFFEKFALIATNIREIFNKKIEVSDIGLRYVNNFSIPMEKLLESFKIAPTISCEEDRDVFAGIANYLSVTNIVSTFDNSLQASIKTAFRALDINNLNIIFDIDTHITEPFTVDAVDDLKNKLSQLKDFKNKIFFSNFINAYDMEEFK